MQKNLSLEGLRGIACLNVVLAHFLFIFLPFTASDVRPYPGAVANFTIERVLMVPPFTFLYLADAAVVVFFVLSGYVLTRRFYETGQTDELQSAAIKRYARLVLPAFASVMLAWLLLTTGAYGNHLANELHTSGWPLDYYKEPVSFGAAVFQGLFAAPLFGAAKLNGPLWSIQVELIGSILLFACYALFGTKSKLWLTLWFLFFGFVLTHSTGVLYYIAILAGSFLHMASEWLRRRQAISAACTLAGLFLVSFTQAPIFDLLRQVPLPNMAPYGPDLSSDPGLFWRTVGAILLVAGVIGWRLADRALSRPVFVYLGRISFSIYLLHMPLIMCLSFRAAQFGQWLGMDYLGYTALAFAATLIALFALAEIFYRCVDKPSVQFAKWLAQGRWPEAEMFPTAIKTSRIS